MAQKIYTKTGDDGTTSLLGGTKVSKSDLRIEAYGTVDELNAYIGLVIDYSVDNPSSLLLRTVQDRLFIIGSELACDPKKAAKLWTPDLHDSDIQQLESGIDEMNTHLPEMKHFILPGGHPLVSLTHVARTVCRRAERNCVRLHNAEKIAGDLIIKYLNRLSDFLFVLSRYFGILLGSKEVQWIPAK